MHHPQVLLLLELPRRTRSGSRAVNREFRGIFFSHLGEIFDGHFETALWNFRDASIFRRSRNGPERIGAGLAISPVENVDRFAVAQIGTRARGLSCRTGFVTTIGCRKAGWPSLPTSSWE